MYQAVQRLPGLTALLESYSGPHQGLLRALFVSPLKVSLPLVLCVRVASLSTGTVQDVGQDFAKFLEMVETTVDLELVDHHEFVIKPSFDEGLTGTACVLYQEGGRLTTPSHRAEGPDGHCGGQHQGSVQESCQ